MSTLKIELINGYYIEVDELNHTLKQRYTGKTKDGQKKRSRQNYRVLLQCSRLRGTCL